MFSVEEFYSDPSSHLETIVHAKKTELLALAAKFSIATSSKSLKAEIRNLILEHCIDNDIIAQSAAEKYITRSETSKVNELQLAIQLEQLKLENEAKRVAMREREMAIKQREMAMKEHEMALENQKAENEVKIALKKAENEAKILLEFERQKSELSVKETAAKLQLESSQPVAFDLGKAVKLVPNFDEAEVDSFFKNFEDIASSMKWPLEQWTWLIKSKLSGKAALIASKLVGERNYKVLKQAVLDAYLITTEGYRRQFRQYVKPHFQTWVEFAHEKSRMLQKWLKSANVTTFDELVNLVVTEEFIRRLPPNMQVYIADKEETNLMKLAMLSDNFTLIHKAAKRPQMNVKQGNATEKEENSDCSYCKQSGHTIDNCPNPHCLRSHPVRFQSKYGRNSTKSEKQTKGKDVSGKQSTLHCRNMKDLDNPFKKFICDGVITLPNSTRSYSVKILRDTASSQTILYKAAVPELRELDERTIIKDLSGSHLLPLANVTLNCKYVVGPVKLAVSENKFPLDDIQLLLGNDVTDDVIITNLIMLENPIAEGNLPESKVDCSKDLVKSEVVSVVTRSQAKISDDSGEVKDAVPILPLDITLDDFKKLQGDDVTLAKAFSQAADKGDKVPGFYLEDNILFRLYRPANLSNEDTWANIEQLVVPLSLREEILKHAHNSESHLGITKTYKRIAYDFYWPNLKRDVANFVKSCYICQIAGKPNETIPKAPLQPIVVTEEPFNKIIVDCVGPLPKTKSGNQYLLTILCPTTRYPIAIPLRNISAKVIVKHLLKLFTVYGFPKEIQSDRGTNFTSDHFKDILLQYNVKHTLSSPYHPESQGALERQHQTLKSLLRKYCVETEKDWDSQIDLLLFVLREVPNESLGISPFEMLYGRKLRGPLKIIKDRILDSNKVDGNVPVTEYVKKLNKKLECIHKFALKNLIKSQEVMKSNFDVKSKPRKFKVGDHVLAYIPIPASPLKHKFSGPYIITQCKNNNNYVINTPDRRKSTQLLHVNLLKPYIARNPVALHCSNSQSLLTSAVINKQQTKPSKEDHDKYLPDTRLTGTELINSSVLSNISEYLQHLSIPQQNELQSLLLKYKNVCADVPRECSSVVHDISLEPGARPIRQQFYRMSREKLSLLKEEVTNLLKQGIVKPSDSPWASPCILVPKPNGKVRMCTDYRKVNNITIKDSFPLPRIDDILDSVGNSKYLTQIDMLKGYYQIPLSPTAKAISAFVTPFGLFQYERLPFGMCNAPATYQRVMSGAIQDLDGTYCYLDDIIVVSDTWKEHIERLNSLFQRLDDMNFTINLAKSTFCRGKVKYLGHVIGSGEVIPKEENIETINKFPTPSNRKELSRFLGMCSYYRRFCKNYSTIAHPLTSLTSPKVKFVWGKEQQSSFDALKLMLTCKPVLTNPDLSRPFSIQIDASDVGIGAVLLQENTDSKVFHPVAYYSSTLKPHQRAYSTIEKELLAIVMTLQKYEVYFQSHLPVRIYTDHNPLVFLNRAQLSNQRLLRWALFLQEFNIKIEHIRGIENSMADTLSRCPSPLLTD